MFDVTKIPLLHLDTLELMELMEKRGWNIPMVEVTERPGRAVAELQAHGLADIFALKGVLPEDREKKVICLHLNSRGSKALINQRLRWEQGEGDKTTTKSDAKPPCWKAGEPPEGSGFSPERCIEGLLREIAYWLDVCPKTVRKGNVANDEWWVQKLSSGKFRAWIRNQTAYAKANGRRLELPEKGLRKTEKD